MGIKLQGVSGDGKILIFSENYAALAECQPRTDGVDEVRVSVQAATIKNLRNFKSRVNNGQNRMLVAPLIFQIIFTVLPILFLDENWNRFVRAYLQLCPLIATAGPFLVLTLFLRLFGGKTLTNHGAEHKAIEAYEMFQKTDLETIKNCSRVSRFCGTRFIALSIFTGFLSSGFGIFLDASFTIILYNFAFVVLIGSFLDLGLYPPIAWLNNLLQRFFTTKEPSENELFTAQCAVSAVVQMELTGQVNPSNQ